MCNNKCRQEFSARDRLERVRAIKSFVEVEFIKQFNPTSRFGILVEIEFNIENNRHFLTHNKTLKKYAKLNYSIRRKVTRAFFNKEANYVIVSIVDQLLGEKNSCIDNISNEQIIIAEKYIKEQTA